MARKVRYDDDSIAGLKGIKPVRVMPGMFVGDATTEFATFQIIKEVVDNSIDEFLHKEADRIDLVIDLKTEEIAVLDNGRGVPQGKIVFILTNLHAGAKFKEHKKDYKYSTGLHGVGVSCTNALSRELKLFSKRESVVGASFSEGEIIHKERKFISLPRIPILRGTMANTPTMKTGTAVIFKPDWSILTYGKIPYERVVKWLNILSKLCAKLRINVIIKNGTKTFKKEFYSEKGLKEYVNKDSFYHEEEYLECLLDFLPEGERKLTGYVNTIAINEGVHLKAFWNALKKVISNYATKKADIPSLPSLRESVSGILHVKIEEPILEGQTKNKLGGVEIEKKIFNTLEKSFKVYFHRKPKIARDIIRVAKEVAKADEDQRKRLQAIREIDSKSKQRKLPINLAVSETRDPTERELFLVEGDSAGGVCKQARNKMFQEVLSLKGKPKNVERAKLASALNTEEIKDIMISMGNKDPEQGRVGKIMFLADSDPDGDHITSLLITLFVKLFPKWVDAGKVYTVDAPLFHMIYKGKRVFGNTAKEVLNQTNGKGDVMRVKGWGEMKPADLEYIAFNQTRKIIQLKGNAAEKKRVLELMGNDTIQRKKLLDIEDFND